VARGWRDGARFCVWMHSLLGAACVVPLLLSISSAMELDAQERELMLSGGTETADAIRFIAEDSSNVDDSGNYSIAVIDLGEAPVLSEPVRTVVGVEAVRYRSPFAT
jgi:hypothetical protein